MRRQFKITEELSRSGVACFIVRERIRCSSVGYLWPFAACKLTLPEAIEWVSQHGELIEEEPR